MRGIDRFLMELELPAYVIKEHILWTLFDWMQALGGIPSMSFVDSLTF